MKRLFHRCGRYRQSICLLASGVLPEPERVAVERHLADCAGCRRYYDEIKLMTGALTSWESSLPHIQPDQALQMRWARAVQGATRAKPVREFTPSTTLILKLWRELIWPCRRTWAGLSAVWLMILAFDLTQADHRQIVVAKSTTRPEEMRLAFQEQQRVLEEILGPTPPAPPAEPARRPNLQPRSERRSIAMA